MPGNDGEAFYFEIPFIVPRHLRLRGIKGEHVVAALPKGPRFVLQAPLFQPLQESEELSLLVHGFDTEAAAKDYVMIAIQLLSLTMVHHGLSIRLLNNQDNADSVSVHHGMRFIATISGSCSGDFISSVDVEALRPTFTNLIANRPKLNERQQASCELLQDFHFDVSPRAQFLIAYTALEWLCPVHKNHEAYTVAVGHLVSFVSSLAVANELRDGLATDVRGLRQDSQARAVRREVGHRLGDAFAAKVDELRGFRNRLAHEGRCPPETLTKAQQTYELARALLLKQLTATA